MRHLENEVIEKKIKIFAVVIWFICSSFYSFHYIAKVAPSVFILSLCNDFSITAFELSGLSSFFYYSYASMQIPAGIILDKFSTKRVLGLAIILAFSGCLMFSFATNIYLIYMGRFLLGLGSSFSFPGAIKLASLWFSSSKFGLVTASTQSYGMIGAAFGAAPIAFASSICGWRLTMFSLSSLFILIYILLLFYIYDSKEDFVSKKINRSKSKIKNTNKDKISISDSLLLIVRNPYSWINAIYAGTIYTIVVSFGELWGPSFISSTSGLSKSISAAIISSMFIGCAVGSPILGYISDRIKKRIPIMYISSFLSLIIFLIILLAKLNTISLFISLFLLGIASTGVGVSCALGAELHPKRITATTAGFTNAGTLLVGALLQPLIGWILDKTWTGIFIESARFYNGYSFRVALIPVIICLAISCILPFFIKETHCKNNELT